MGRASNEQTVVSARTRTASRLAESSDDPVLVGRLLRSAAYIKRLKQLTGGLIIDMDDTLHSNRALFIDAHDALWPIFRELHGTEITDDELDKILVAAGERLVPLHGYTPKRWYLSCEQVAEQLADRPLTSVERAAVEQAAGIAMGVGEVFPGVNDALVALHQAGTPIVLKTKGEVNKQQEKLAAHGFSDLFRDRVEIVGAKSSESFRQIAAKYGLTNPVSIGDSKASDVIPALEAGFRAVLIERKDATEYSWDAKSDDATGAMHATSFAHAIKMLADLT